MQLWQVIRVGSSLVAHQHAALGSVAAAAAAASSSLIPAGIAAYSQTVPGPTPVQGTGGGDRPSTNDETRDLARYGSSMAEPSGRTAIELETEEIMRAEAGEHVFDSHVAEEEEVPEWKRAAMLQDSSTGSDSRASSPTDANRQWLSADDLGTRAREATANDATPRWPKPGVQVLIMMYTRMPVL